MEKLSPRKQLAIVRSYLAGLSYDEIAARAGVSKGTVANVVADLKAGQIPEAQEPEGQIEALRELAVDLKKCRLTPGQAVAGVATLSHLQELGVEPAEIKPWVGLCRELAAPGTEAQALVRAALSVTKLRERTGLSAEALEEKVQGLEREVARLEPLAQELGGCEHKLEDLQKRRQALADEVGQLEKRRQPLLMAVTQKEQREVDLSHRVQELEERAQAADEQLAAARRELEVLAGLGLPLEDLPGFLHRLAGVAQRHGIKPGALREWLVHELEELEAGLGLKSHLQVRKRELKEIEGAVEEAQRQRQALDSVVQQLRQQQAGLHAAIAEGQDQARKEVQAIARTARDSAAELRQQLRSGMGEALLEVQQLKEQALQLGQEVGCLDYTIKVNRWLESLLAIAADDDSVNPGEVRVVGLVVLRGMQRWIQRNQDRVAMPLGLGARVSAVIEDLERWKT